MTVRLTEFRRWDDRCEHVAEHMRQADVDEVWALNRSTARESLQRSVRVSNDKYIALADDEPMAVFGNFTASLSRTGVPWFLGTERVAEFPVAFVKQGQAYVRHLMKTHDELRNIVSTENTASIKFLSAIGFAIHEPIKLRTTWATARHFTMRG